LALSEAYKLATKLATVKYGDIVSWCSGQRRVSGMVEGWRAAPRGQHLVLLATGEIPLERITARRRPHGAGAGIIIFEELEVS
jgi:hypothetical protein